MKHIQLISSWLAPALFFVLAAGLATAKADSRKTNAWGPLSIVEPGAQKTFVAPAGSQNNEDKGVGNQLPATRQPLAPNQLDQEIEIEYAIGMAALRMKNWPRAILAFEKIQEAERKFRDVEKRLAQARRGLARESEETVAARYYAEGVSAMSQNDFGRALAAFEKTGQLKPNYREVDSLVTAIETILQRKTALAAASSSSDSLYEEAQMAMDRADWPHAVAALEHLRSTQPDYRDAIALLVRARVNMEKAESAGTNAASAGSRALLYAGVTFAGLIVLSALGVIGFSPATRARLHLLRGNPAAAVQIYERILQRHPERVKFYLPLANIYLNSGSRDERAMRAYKTILYLNLATRDREEINSIVAQKYLTEGRIDSDAIAVLEDALKTERRKQGQT